MTASRRKRTAEEQALFDDIDALKAARVDQQDQIRVRIEKMYATKPDEETDEVLGSLARDVLAARRDLDRTNARLVELQAKYDALRARPTEDVPL